jgi:hypothetical protein
MSDIKQVPNLSQQTFLTDNSWAFARLRELGTTYRTALDTARSVSLAIEDAVETGQAAGYSLESLSEATGLTVEQIEYILVSVDVQRRQSAL